MMPARLVGGSSVVASGAASGAASFVASAVLLALSPAARAAPDEPTQPATRSPPRERDPVAFALSATALVGRAHIARENYNSTSASTHGVAIGAALYPIRYVALLGEVWWQRSPESCPGDAECFSDPAAKQTMITVGARLVANPVVSFDIAGGRAYSRMGDGTATSGVGAVSLNLIFPLGALRGGAVLRVATTSVMDTQITTVSLGLQLAKRW